MAWGVGDPDVANRPLVYSTIWLTPLSTTHRLPDGSKAVPVGTATAPEGNVMVTLGTGLGMPSWALVNSTTVPVFRFTVHKSPHGSKAMATGPYMSFVNLASGATSPLEFVLVDVHLPVFSATVVPMPLPAVPKIRASLGDDHAPRGERMYARRGRSFGRCYQR